jgi:hypothetical protein
MTRNYDKKMLVDWHQQLMGELKSEQLELEGKSVPPGVQQGLTKFRSKWGTEIVPSFDTFEFALAAFYGHEEEERKKLAEARRQQFETAMAFWQMLKEVGIVKLKNKEEERS